MGLIIRNFTYTGTTQTFVVPQLVEFVTFKLWGAGAGNSGGPGGYTTGSLNVAQGDSFNIVVGGGGARLLTTSTFGGGAGAGNNTFDGFFGSQGGGMSSVTKNPSTLMLIAGGGGGGSSAGATFSNGGCGGGTNGISAFGSGTPAGNQGQGATQIAGGAGGVNAAGAFSNGFSGSQFLGGRGGASGNVNCGSGGGGGGGYYGGGGGAGQFSTASAQDSAGGGGSSYIGPVINGSTQSSPQITSTNPPASAYAPPNITDSQYISPLGYGGAGGVNGRNGLVVITYTLPDITPTKFVDKAYASIGDILNYTISVYNPGPVTVPNVIFVDTVPLNATFITDSLKVDGTSIPGTSNPPGITIPSIGVGVTATVTFSVLIATLPNPKTIQNSATTSYSGGPVINSNIVSTEVNNGDLSSNKAVNKAYATVGDTLIYTIVLKNIGNVTTENIQFIDNIPDGTVLLSNTFTQNGITIPNANPSIAVPLQNIVVGATTTIQFQVKVTTIPNPNPIQNQSRAIYNYYFSPSQTGKSGDVYSNIAFTQINYATLENIVKYTDKTYVTCGDTITYTIVIPNSGNVTAQNVVFKDTIPNGTSFIISSVTVNNVLQATANPNTGITIPNILPGVTATLEFSVKVVC